MKITNYKEEDKAQAELNELELEIKNLNAIMWAKQQRANKLEDAIKDYNDVQAALNE